MDIRWGKRLPFTTAQLLPSMYIQGFKLIFRKIWKNPGILFFIKKYLTTHFQGNTLSRKGGFTQGYWTKDQFLFQESSLRLQILIQWNLEVTLKIIKQLWITTVFRLSINMTPYYDITLQHSTENGHNFIKTTTFNLPNVLHVVKS